MTRRGRKGKLSMVATQSSRLKTVICLAVLLAGFSVWKFVSRSVQANNLPAMSVATTEVASAGTSGFSPTVENKNAAAGSVPQGMAWIPGGEFSMGAQDPPENDAGGRQATLDSRPIHRVYVDGFWMDKTDGTNAE